MLDIRLIRENPDVVREALKKRQSNDAVVDTLAALDEKRREILSEVEELKAERNTVSKEIGRMKDAESRQEKISAMRAVGDKIKSLDDELRDVDVELTSTMATLPNIPSDATPYGVDESENVVLKTVGEIPEFNFDPKPHWDLGPELEIIDFERGVKMTGSRFYVLSGAGARLQRALIAYMLDLHIKQGYVEKYTPFMVKTDTVYGAGQLPKFAGNLYKDHEEDLYMVPTAEVPLTGYHMDEIFEDGDLPKNYTAYTPCFRREKMSAGRDVRGIKRGHQFDKVEMYMFVKPEDSDAAFEKMMADAEETVALLGLPYRIHQLCTGDLGFGATITYDIEVWAAGCNEWLEVSSVSNVTDFQARRANIRYRPEDSKRNEFVHTLNGSGMGLPRVMIAIMENYQQEDGSIIVPEILRPWMGGIEVIQAE
ncbi:MAG: serine--tRNA ligase [Anaerolineae bacterium]|jgi:seryl-tRNA synthetase|nr:serine--tRNA ligase [Anaerolineae bacterium]MBT4309099.1 serine--tRNA ligase [Anaerolineae bacterium]MBT4460160.1 serine--tRNA ligase [Anaerolineae bacterium]MBT4843143.1 serine--tRNA ligase [Anaerolineae bacterium]MBT6059815.1 serine--tRNA ligase [Anaerolineae bacterium]